MAQQKPTFSVFTKPWKIPLPELGRLIAGLGFDGVELPVRPGFQVEPEHAGQDLPVAVRQLGEFGLKISSVAAQPTEALIATCGELGIPIIRLMASIGDEDYLAGERRWQQELDRLLPLLESYGVKLGIQNHNGRYVSETSGLRRLIERYDPRYVGAVWDAGHSALNGELPELALDIVWSHLCMVNLKNAFWRRTSGPEAEDVQWRPYWTTGRQGLASWREVVAELRRRDYTDVVCLTAQYTDEAAVERLIGEDLLFAKSLFPR